MSSNLFDRKFDFLGRQHVSIDLTQMKIMCANICAGENKVFSSNEKREFENKKKDFPISSWEKKREEEKTHIFRQSLNRNQRTGGYTPDGIIGKTDLLSHSTPLRKEKVKEAKKKKQRGDYNSEEVYKKIADKLMDLFGVK